MTTKICAFILCLVLFSCTFYVGKEKASQDVKAYLEAEYKEPFEIIHCQWLCNEGNGCPDYYILTCRPKSNRFAVFQVEASYQNRDKKLKITDDSYRSGLLDGIFALEIDSLIRAKYPFIKKFVPITDISFSFNHASKPYTAIQISNGEFFEEQMTELRYYLDLYIYHDLPSHQEEYLQLLKEIFMMQADKKVGVINIQMYFYRESYYQNTSLDSLDKIQRDFDIGTNIQNKHLQYEWAISAIRGSYPSIIANFEEEVKKYDERDVYDLDD